jgi:hypothetical protein
MARSIEDGVQCLTLGAKDGQFAAGGGGCESRKPAVKTVPDSQDNLPCDRDIRGVESPVGRRSTAVLKPLYTMVKEGYSFIGQSTGMPSDQLRESD